MRIWVIAAAIGAFLPAAAAVGQVGTPAQPTVKARSSAGQPAPAATPGAANEEARRREAERHKRWDERMRRATKSLCDRC
jgi:hypothetical protein